MIKLENIHGSTTQKMTKMIYDMKSKGYVIFTIQLKTCVPIFMEEKCLD